MKDNQRKNFFNKFKRKFLSLCVVSDQKINMKTELTNAKYLYAKNPEFSTHVLW